MRQTREILRQKWCLGRTHREVAQSLGISSGAVGTTVLRARAAGLDWAQVEALTDEALEARVYGPPTPAHASSRRPGLRLPAHRAAQARRHPRTAPPRVPRAASRRLPLHPVLRALPPVARSAGACRCARSTAPARSCSSTTPARSRDSSIPPPARSSTVELFVAVAGRLELHLRRSHAHAAGPGLDREPPAGLRVLRRRPRGRRARPAQERRRRPVPLRARACSAPTRSSPSTTAPSSCPRARRNHGTRRRSRSPSKSPSGGSSPASATRPSSPSPPSTPASPSSWRISTPGRCASTAPAAASSSSAWTSPRSARCRPSLRLRRVEDRRPRQHRLPRRAPRALLLRPPRAPARARRRPPHRDHRRDLPSRPARGRPRPRRTVRGRHTTEPAHMPKAHQRHLEWTPSRLIDWARTIGPQTAALVEAILADRPHPEQGYRSCLGHPAPRQALRGGAAGGRLRPRRRRRRALLPARRRHPQARPRSPRAAGGRAAAHPRAGPRTPARAGLLPVKERRCSTPPPSNNSTPSSSAPWPRPGPTNSSRPT